MNTAQENILSGPAPLRVQPSRVIAAIGAAVILNLLIMWVGDGQGATWEIDSPYDLNALAVALFTAVPMLLGWAVVAVVTLRSTAAPRWFAWGGAAFALVSAAMPFSASSDTTTSVSLALMHLVVGAAWLAGVLPRPAAR